MPLSTGGAVPFHILEDPHAFYSSLITQKDASLGFEHPITSSHDKAQVLHRRPLHYQHFNCPIRIEHPKLSTLRMSSLGLRLRMTVALSSRMNNQSRVREMCYGNNLDKTGLAAA